MLSYLSHQWYIRDRQQCPAAGTWTVQAASWLLRMALAEAPATQQAAQRLRCVTPSSPLLSPCNTMSRASVTITNLCTTPAFTPCQAMSEHARLDTASACVQRIAARRARSSADRRLQKSENLVHKMLPLSLAKSDPRRLIARSACFAPGRGWW